MTKQGSFQPVLAGSITAAAALVAAGLLFNPAHLTGQPPAAASSKVEPAGAVPRTPDGKPDFTGFWNYGMPSGNVNIEPAAGRGGGGGGRGPGGPGGPGAGKGGPGAGGPGGAGGGAPQVAGGGPGAGKGGPGGGPGAGGPGGPGAAKGPGGGGRGGNTIIDPADGRVPYTMEARAKADNITAKGMYGEPSLHCFPEGVPHQMWVQFGVQVVQTKQYLVWLWEFNHDRRIIPLDGRPNVLPANVRQFQGESSGSWDGDVLMVHTTNQSVKNWFDTSGHYQPEDADVIERFTMMDSNTIHYEATVTSKEFTQPMKVAGNMTRSQPRKFEPGDPPYETMEFACVEGNKDVSHYTDDEGGNAKNVGPLKQ